MCCEMANVVNNHEGVVDESIRKRLASVIRTTQWSYAVFWSISTQQGVLQWADGYYNGDIKTRKTVQSLEFNSHEINLQRTEQLRELYLSLSIGETNLQGPRITASLSPEDLSDAEWYYLVCMSFMFGPGQGLPGKALANGQHIWLLNAPYADGKVFSRSLLAKSASIQTVLCIPIMDGVLELGVTELISEDPNLIQRITAMFLEYPNPDCSDQSTSSFQKTWKEDQIAVEHNLEMENILPLEKVVDYGMCQENGDRLSSIPIVSYMNLETDKYKQDQVEKFCTNIYGEPQTGSHDSSNGFGPQQQTEDSFMLDGMNGNSHLQSFQFMDDELSNGLHDSVNSSDCISESFVNPIKAVSLQKDNNPRVLTNQDIQECSHTKFSHSCLGIDNLHYSRIISEISKNPNRSDSMPSLKCGSRDSSFTRWIRCSMMSVKKKQGIPSQEVLKKILFEVSWMKYGGQLRPQENGSKCGTCKVEGDDNCMNHGLSERRRREKLNEKFLVLRSLVPSIGKADKASLLGDTIKYLKDLERRIEELESCRDVSESETRGRKKCPDIIERTSDNYGYKGTHSPRTLSATKRKAHGMEEPRSELNWVLCKDGFTDISVTIIEKEVLIKLRCPWKEGLLLDIVDSITSLHLDTYSVQSSNENGILSLTLKSKGKGEVASVGMIKQALQRVAGKL